jgi:hypothetical protein
VMTKTHTIHEQHAHQHGSNCGHIAVKHNGHIDYLHDGHLHFLHEGHVDEHVIETSASNPAGCTPDHVCLGHEKGHKHGVGLRTRGSSPRRSRGLPGCWSSAPR